MWRCLSQAAITMYNTIERQSAIQGESSCASRSPCVKTPNQAAIEMHDDFENRDDVQGDRSFFQDDARNHLTWP